MQMLKTGYLECIAAIAVATAMCPVASANEWDFNLPPELSAPGDATTAPEIEPPSEERSFQFRPIPRLGNPGFVSQLRRGDTLIKLRVQQKKAALKLTLPIRRKK